MCWSVPWWLIKPIFALNCPLQIEQVNSESDDSVMMIIWVWFCALCAFVQLRRFSLLHSYPHPFWWGDANLLDPVQSVPRTLVCWNPLGRLLGCLCGVSTGYLGNTFPPEVLLKVLSLVAAHQTFLWHGHPSKLCKLKQCTHALHPCPF